jgi:Cu(I)/Ag(I) efflux system membrane fusion protein
MKSGLAVIVGFLAIFLLGAAATVALIWNPGHWGWADRLFDRLHPATDAGSRPAEGGRKIKYWRAPMNPNYISDKPGKSPMGMDLVPVYEDEVPAESGVHVDPNFLQNFMVRTAAADRGAIPVDSRTVGVLDFDQKHIVSVNTKFEGWIESARANYIGEEIHRGDVLFEIYSPQLVTTQEEYLSALTFWKKLSAGGQPDAIRRARDLVQATRERLRYWDISTDQVDELERSGKITRTLKIVSPASGVITAKMADSLEGMKLTPGMNVYKIADLSTVWVQIQVFEYQIRYIRLGLVADITLDAFPGRHWRGRIIYLDPTLDQKTRTLKVSVELPNPDLVLRPQMYANVVIRVPAAAAVVRVPEEAVLHTGERSVVIVRKGPTVFEPREVDTGASGGGYVEIRHGVAAGEVVVTSSQFLIDSESNLKAAISAMQNGMKPAMIPSAAPGMSRDP